MKALVMGAVNDRQTKVLVETGANTSAISEFFAKGLRLKRVASQDKRFDIQGISKHKVANTSRAAFELCHSIIQACVLRGLSLRVIHAEPLPSPPGSNIVVVEFGTMGVATTKFDVVDTSPTSKLPGCRS
ncbi:hypothetical protein JG687_00018263 [Phytophthora cactorum]|uniref:Peptidase A2 domain-containing protein n=1 Tax=Phytophthora cactorum TaxID=29920 RepID=A0A8T1TL07_9STRA|nr:hypothetical protein JG687_00018263 [Phytophthora cactorum]